MKRSFFSDKGAMVSQINGTRTGPHVHLVRYHGNGFDPINTCNNRGTCNWTMFGVPNIDLAARNDWVFDEDSGNWYYYVNNMRRRGRVHIGTDFIYFDNTTGAFTGIGENSQGTFFFWNGTGWNQLG